MIVSGGHPPQRVVFVTNIPSPYQIDFCNAAEHHRSGGLHVVFCAASESDRQFAGFDPASAAFSCEVLGSRGRRWMVDWHRNAVLEDRLDQLQPRLIVLGGSYVMPDARTTRRFCLRRRVPWVYWGEHPFKKGPGGARGRLRRTYLRWFLRPAAGAIGIGKRAEEAYGSLLHDGATTTNIPYAPDLSALLSPSAVLLEKAAEVKKEWFGAGSAGAVILFSGALIERKAPDLLLEGFASIADEDPGPRLVLAGDGPLQPSLRQAVERRRLGDRCLFLGFLRGDDLRAAYLAADIFVLPSRWHEGWGVVVQEAMAAGLATVVSDVVGAGEELLAEEGAGLRFKAEDVTGLARTLRRLLRDEPLRRALGAAARQRVRATSASEAAARFWGMVDRVSGGGLPPSGCLPPETAGLVGTVRMQGAASIGGKR